MKNAQQKNFSLIRGRQPFRLVLLLLLVYLASVRQYAFAGEPENWTLAFSKFELENVPELYSSYAELAPSLLSFNLSADNYRMVPLEEKKARALLDLTQKKLQAISELNALILQKDKIFLSQETEKKKAKKVKKLEKQIEKKRKKIDLLRADFKIEDLRAAYADADSLRHVEAWNKGSLFSRTEEKALAVDLRDNNISALVSGTIKDISGYLVISAALQTGLAKVPEISVTEAGTYGEFDRIMETLALLLYANLQALPERKLYFEIQPKGAKVFVNDTEVVEPEKPLSVYASSIEVYASADGFESAANRFDFKEQNLYRLKINLRKIETKNVAVAVPPETDIYAKTKKAETETTPDGTQKLNVENKKNILEFENEEGVRTFVVVDPDKLKTHSDGTPASVELNTKPPKTKIEKQRSIMYWSLGAAYISLPITLILVGIRNDKLNSMKEGRLPYSDKNAASVRNLTIAADTMIGVSSALAVNYLVQVALYLVQADKALPRTLK